MSVDLVVFADRSPNLDLVLAAGAAVERRGDTIFPVLGAFGRTSVPSLSVVGSAAGRPIVGIAEADAARAAGRAAGASRSAAEPAPVPPSADPARPGPARTDPPASVARGAMVCFCEDVRAWEIRAEQAAGYLDPELIKRRTGTLTGPCQGKSCLQSFACLVGDGADGAVAVPTARPPLRPVRLGDLVASPTDDGGRP